MIILSQVSSSLTIVPFCAESAVKHQPTNRLFVCSFVCRLGRYVTDVSPREKLHCRQIYGCGGGLLMAPINAHTCLFSGFYLIVN